MNSALIRYKGYIAFPCCPKEKIIPYSGATGYVSIKCPRCGGFITFDLDNMTASKTGAARGVVKQLNKENLSSR